MWLLKFIPTWLPSLIFFLGILGYLITTTLSKIPYSQVVKLASIFTILASIYVVGMQYADEVWQQRSRDLQQKVLELEVKSQQENTKIVERVVTKREVVKQRGEDIIKYVDREVLKNQEVVKYVEQCPKLPSEIVNTINKAAKP